MAVIVPGRPVSHTSLSAPDAQAAKNTAQGTGASKAPTQAATAASQGTVTAGPQTDFYDFLGTLAWILLVAGLVLFFRKHVRRILSALVVRLARGAPVEASWMRAVSSQTTRDVADRMERETTALMAAFGSDPGFAPPAREIIAARLALAEDLAMKEIQAEFGVPVSRNVAVRGQEFGGLLLVGPIGYAVEIKLARAERSQDVALRGVHELSDALRRLGARNARGLIAIVHDADVDLEAERMALKDVAASSPVLIECRAYSLADLEQRYGLSARQNMIRLVSA